MDTLRKAAQQALEALEEIALAGMSPAPEMIDSKEAFHARQAWRFIGIAARQLTALRAALAEQPAEQEPVAWMYFDSDGDAIFGHPNGYRPDDAVPVYTAPQPRREVELTDEEIDALPWGPSYDNPMTLTEGLRNFARAVIAAYKAKQGEAE